MVTVDKIKRFVAPSRFDYADQGTVWHIIEDEESIGEIYIQISNNKDNPEWITIGEFLKLVFADKLDCGAFIESCLKAYKEKDFKDLINYL